MSLDRDERVQRDDSIDVRRLPLTPNDAFVLSLVSGAPRIAEVIAATGMERGEAEACLTRLLQHGALRPSDDPAATSLSAGQSVKTTRIPTGRMRITPANDVREVSVAVSPNFRDRAADRKAQQLRAHLQPRPDAKLTGHEQPRPAAKSNESIPIAAKPPTESSVKKDPKPDDSTGSGTARSLDRLRHVTQKTAIASEPKIDQPPAADEVQVAKEDQPRWGQVAASDGRLDVSLPMSLEVQRRVYWLRDHEEGTPDLEVLGLPPQADLVAARSAYHAASRWLHPDAYYGKALGVLRPELEKAFATVRRAFERLSRGVGVVKSSQGSSDKKGASEGESEKRAERAAEYYAQGQRELENGHLQGAASLFRIALEIEPSRELYHKAWQSAWVRAQQEKARKARSAAERSLDLGDPQAAAQHFEIAVRANPSASNLAAAAACIAIVTPARGRELALSAIDALHVELSTQSLSPGGRCEVHLSCARAFITLGQVHSAQEQLENARKLCPDHVELPGLQRLLHTG